LIPPQGDHTVPAHTGAPSAATNNDEAATGFGIAEILYIASCHDAEASHQSQEHLALASIDDGGLAAAGASSLLARGHAHVRDDALELTGPASLLEYVLATAHRWTHIGLLD